MDELLAKLNLNPDDPYVPSNYKGTMGEEPVEVTYYYVKQAKVIVKYIDKETEEPVQEDTTIPGMENSYYKVDPIEIENYDLVTDPEYTPTNNEGYMTVEDTIVKYYYEQKAKVVVNYINIKDESKIDSDEIEGHVKDLYKTDELDDKEYPNYRIVTNKEYYEWYAKKNPSVLTDNEVTTVGELLAKLELGELDPYIPANYKGEMTKDEIVVNYYYIKQAKVIVKHIDEDTNEVIKSEEKTYDVGDQYVTGPEDIENYKVDENKLPANANGEVKDGGVEVKYYYKKETKPSTDPNTNTNTNTNTTNTTPAPTPTSSPAPSNPAPSQGQPTSSPNLPQTGTNKTITRKLPMTGDRVLQITISTMLLVIIANILVTVRQKRSDIKVEKEIDVKIARIEKEYGKLNEGKDKDKDKAKGSKKKGHGKRYKK